MTLEQTRAALAFRHVEAIGQRGDADKKKMYASMAQKLPVLIRTAGLCQALHFVKSRKDKDEVLGLFLGHIAEQLQRTDREIQDGEKLCEKAREADLNHYLWMTREALASAEWYARLSQSELGISRDEASA